MTKHAPATPLPWYSEAPRGGIRGDGKHVYLHHEGAAASVCRADSQYVAHACNAYPRLVERLKVLEAMAGWLAVRCAESDVLICERATEEQTRAAALLTELGEDA